MKNILIFHPAGIGDFLMDLPNLYQLIHSKLSPNRFKYVCHDSVKPLARFFELNQILDICFLKYPTLKFSDIIQLLSHRKNVDNVFVLGGMNLKKVGTLKKLIFKDADLFGTLQDFPQECIREIEPNGSTYNYIMGPTENSHRIIENFNLFKSQGLVEKDDFLIDEIIAGPSVTKLEPSCKYSTNDPYIILHTGLVKGNSYKSMSLDYWKKLLFELVKIVDGKIIVIGSLAEKLNVDSIISQINNIKIKNYCGMTNLVETLGLISKSEMVLAVDGGMAHLAATLKRKLIVIFGPTNPNHTSPVGTEGYIISNPIECSPCYFSENYYDCPYDRKCINDLETSQILEVVTAVKMQHDFKNTKTENFIVQKIQTFEDLKTYI